MLKIDLYQVSPLLQNARLLHCTETNRSVLVDPGGNSEELIAAINNSKSELEAVWLTHSHLDHCGAANKILKTFNVKLYAHKFEEVMRANVESIARLYGFSKGEFENSREPDVFMEDGDILPLGKFNFKALFTPGHSPGHISFYNKENNLLIAGDVLFAGSIGRTDLPGGDHNLLIKSVREKLFTLPPETKVLPGHGEDTTIGQEIGTNPFFKEVY